MKKIYIVTWENESGDSGVVGFWDKPLTEDELHGLFYDGGDYPDYEDVRFVGWDQDYFVLQDRPEPLPKEKQKPLVGT
jgi:hypothetical protein